MLGQGSAITPGLRGKEEAKKSESLFYFLLSSTRLSWTQRQRGGLPAVTC